MLSVSISGCSACRFEDFEKLSVNSIARHSEHASYSDIPVLIQNPRVVPCGADCSGKINVQGPFMHA